MSLSRLINTVLMLVVTAGCASFAGGQERYVICSYDHAWDAALDSVKDRSVTVKDKDKGMIQTAWLEMPMPGRTFGVFQREMKDSKDRSRLMVTVKQMSDVTKVSFVEERERWAFRGGSRLFGWVPTDPSEEATTSVQSRLDAKLKERGCTTT